MDNATHTLTGLFLSRAGLNRFTPHATIILVLSANLPDADAVSLLGGSVSYLHWHRNLSHSMAVAPVLALLTVGILRLFNRPVDLLAGFLVALAGVASHLLLDLTNVYGVRLLLPLSGEWFHWDLTPVVDFWLWGVFLICVAAPFLSKLVSSEMGAARKPKYPSRGFAFLALGFLVIYNAGRMVAHVQAIGTLETREYEGGPPLRVAAFPASENPLRWKGLTETARSYYIFQMDLSGPFDPALGESARKADESPAIDAANQTRPFQILREFSVYPFYQLFPAVDWNGGTRVELSDLRFPFSSTAILDRNHRVINTWFQFTGSPR